MTMASVLRMPEARRLSFSVRKGTWQYLVRYSGSITIASSSWPHSSNISLCSTYSTPKLECSSVNVRPHLVTLSPAEMTRSTCRPLRASMKPEPAMSSLREDAPWPVKAVRMICTTSVAVRRLPPLP